MAEHVAQARAHMAAWGMVCSWSESSFALMARAMRAWLLPNGDPALSDACAWLPPPEKLVRLARDETAWDVWLTGAQHPALLCALVYERLGSAAEAHAVADGLLVCCKQPLTRVVAWRLLARIQAPLGSPHDAAWTPLRRAIEEATAAGYAFLALVVACELCLRGGCTPEEPRGIAKGILSAQVTAADIAQFMVEDRVFADWGVRALVDLLQEPATLET